jgi:hypothetical protein
MKAFGEPPPPGIDPETPVTRVNGAACAEELIANRLAQMVTTRQIAFVINEPPDAAGQQRPHQRETAELQGETSARK